MAPANERNWMKMRELKLISLKKLKMEMKKDNILTRHISSLPTDWILLFLHFLAYDNPFRRLVIHSIRASFCSINKVLLSLSQPKPVNPHVVVIDYRLEEFHIWRDNDVIYYFRIFKVCMQGNGRFKVS